MSSEKPSLEEDTLASPPDADFKSDSPETVSSSTADSPAPELSTVQPASKEEMNKIDEIKDRDDDTAETSQQRPAKPASTSPTNPPMSPMREYALVTILTCAQLFTQSGLSQVLAPEYIIGSSFGISDQGKLSWYSAAYSLTVGTFILPAGRLGDVYGHKKLFIFGWLWFSLFSLVAGFAVYVTPGPQGSKFFNIMRAMQGIGPAVLLPNAIALMGRTYSPGPRKNMVFSIFGAAAPNGAIIGGVFASLLAEYAWWPWALWIQAIAALILAGLAVLVVPGMGLEDEDSHLVEKNPTWRLRWSTLDMNGTLTGVTGLVLINTAWNQGPLVGWPTPYVYVLLIIGFLFMFVFFYIEYNAEHPLIPLQKIGKEVVFVLGCVACGWSSFGIWLFYLWQMLLVLRHHRPLLASAQFIPPSISGLVASIGTGFLLGRIGPGPVMMIAMIAFCVGNVLLATMPVDQIYWAQTFVSLVVTPFGMDMSFPSATIIMSNSMPREQQGMAASLVTTVVNYSISLGLGFAGTVETQILSHGASTLEGYRAAWYTGIGLAGLGIIVALDFNLVAFLESRKVDIEVPAPEDKAEQ